MRDKHLEYAETLRTHHARPMKFDTLPETCLVDETLHIRVLDVEPGTEISLKLWSKFGELILMSSAIFKAGSDGIVDLSLHAPISGSYAGVDAMGLFWSRAPVNPEIATEFGGKSDDPLTATLIAESSATHIYHLIRRVYLGPDVRSRDVRASGLFGKMFEPAKSGPYPAVLVVGGSVGGLGWSYEVAALLASQGYAALALAYFAAEGLPDALDRIPIEYFGTALLWMSAQTTVSPERIAVVGDSRGGELALLLGSTYPQIRAVVAYVPSGILWPAYPDTGHSAWTMGGQELFSARTLTYAEWDLALATGDARQDSFDWYLIPLRDAAYADKVSIQVEKINGPVLMISGMDDALWPSTDLAEFAVRRFAQHGFFHDVIHLKYSDAGHSITWPNGPTTMLNYKHPVTGELVDLGGTAEGTARARSDSWPRMLEFLRRALMKK